MTHISAVCNQKGGVGKTALTINLGAALADQGQRVLLIDLDPQGHLTEGVGLQDLYLSEKKPSLYTALIDTREVPADALLHKHPKERFIVIPSHYEMMLAEQSLFQSRNREHKLKKLIEQLDGRFDWILIDCPPNLGMLTDNALNAARRVIVPIQADSASVRALDLLFDQIESVERGLNIHVEVLAVIPNQVQDSAISKRILSSLRENIPMVAPFDIRKRVMLQEAWDKGCSIFSYQPESSAQERTKHEIEEIFRDAANYVVEREEGGTDGR